MDEDITYQVSDVPPKKRKTQEDKETEKVEVESTGGGFDAGLGDMFSFSSPNADAGMPQTVFFL